MDIPALRSEVEILLANDMIMESIYLMQDGIYNQEVKNELINLERRFKNNENHFRKGLINQDSHSIEKNKLVHSLLHIFADLMGEVKSFNKSNKEVLRSKLAKIVSQESFKRQKLEFHNTKENVSIYGDIVEEIFRQLEIELTELDIEYPNRIKVRKQDFPRKQLLIGFGNNSIFIDWSLKYGNSVKEACLKILLWDRKVSIIEKEFHFPSGQPGEIFRRRYQPAINERYILGWRIVNADKGNDLFYDNRSIVEFILGEIAEYI